MRIVIPMAGQSRRFAAAGYKTPKPFILIDGKPMIERVCRMFSASDEFIFICSEDHLRNNDYFNILKKSAVHSKIIGIKEHELGPVHSILSVKNSFADVEEPILITYCDFLMQWDYRQFVFKAQNHDGAMAVFKGFHPASFGNTNYAYVRANADFEMVEIREKQSFTANRSEEYASTGIYFLDSYSTFEHYAKKLMANSMKVGAEYYCSLLYNPMVADGKKIALFEVQKFICLGTPEDLHEYRFWSEYYANHANAIALKELIHD